MPQQDAQATRDQRSNGDAGPPRRNLWRVIRRAVLVLLLLATVAALSLYGLWRSKPSSFYSHQQFLETHDTAERRALAKQIEGTLSSALSHTGRRSIHDPIRTKPPASVDGDSSKSSTTSNSADNDANGVREVTVSLDQAKAWLDQRLEQVLRERWQVRWPRSVRQPTLNFEDGRLTFAAQVNVKDFWQWVTVDASVEVEDDGKRAKLHFTRARAGRLPLGADTVVNLVRRRRIAPNHVVDALRNALNGGHPFEPVHKTPDGNRRARLLGYTIKDDTLTVRLKIEGPDDTPS